MTDNATRHNQAVYDEIAPVYARRQAGREPGFADLRSALTARLRPGADLADLGCGPARDGRLFAAAGYRVAGADRSAGMLAVAARSLPGRVVQADLRCLPFGDGSLDGIWCCAALLHVPHGDTAVALREMRRVLRHPGYLALITAMGEGARLEPVPYAPGEQRWFFYRQAAALRRQLHAAGLPVVSMTEEPTSRHWLKVLASAT